MTTPQERRAQAARTARGSAASRPFVFLDRDGTLVRDLGYTHRLSDYQLLEGVKPALRRLIDAGYGLVIVTNQSGIGRGYYAHDDYARFQRHLESDLASDDIRIEASYHCPHLPAAHCCCRKPAPGLLERARLELAADLSRSFVIGDSPGDIELATHAGCRAAVLVLTGQGARSSPLVAKDVMRAANLDEAARWLEREASRERGVRGPHG